MTRPLTAPNISSISPALVDAIDRVIVSSMGTTDIDSPRIPPALREQIIQQVWLRRRAPGARVSLRPGISLHDGYSLDDVDPDSASLVHRIVSEHVERRLTNENLDAARRRGAL